MDPLTIDLHSHVMPGIDDGARGPVETVAMARGLADLGVKTLYLTPHQFKLDNHLSLVDVQRRTDDVWRMLARAGVTIEVRRGAEHYYGEDLLDAISGGDDLITFDLDGEPGLLVELPMRQPTIGVRRVGAALLQRGIRPVMAHPERTAYLSREYGRVDGWREAGWRFQLNLLSLVGQHGGAAQSLAEHMMEDGLYDYVGSDLHRPSDLPWLRRAHEAYRAATEGVVSS